METFPAKGATTLVPAACDADDSHHRCDNGRPGVVEARGSSHSLLGNTTITTDPEEDS
jgi:hypothetical protein